MVILQRLAKHLFPQVEEQFRYELIASFQYFCFVDRLRPYLSSFDRLRSYGRSYLSSSL